MTVTKNCVVTLDYTVKASDGQMVDEGKEPLVYVHGGYENIFAPVEKAMEGKSVGDSFKVPVSAAEGFGEYDEELLMIETLDNLPEDLRVGMQLEGYMPDGDEEDTILYTVTEIKDDKAVLDGNHPLAGIDMVFEGTVSEIHAASQEEIDAMLHHNHSDECGCGDH